MDTYQRAQTVGSSRHVPGPQPVHPQELLLQRKGENGVDRLFRGSKVVEVQDSNDGGKVVEVKDNNDGGNKVEVEDNNDGGKEPANKQLHPHMAAGGRAQVQVALVSQMTKFGAKVKYRRLEQDFASDTLTGERLPGNGDSTSQGMSRSSNMAPPVDTHTSQSGGSPSIVPKSKPSGRPYLKSHWNRGHSDEDEVPVLTEMETLRPAKSKLMAVNEGLKDDNEGDDSSRDNFRAHRIAHLKHEGSHDVTQSKNFRDNRIAQLEQEILNITESSKRAAREKEDQIMNLTTVVGTYKLNTDKYKKQLSELEQSNSVTKKVFDEMETLRQGMSELIVENEGLVEKIENLNDARKTLEDRITEQEQEIHDVTESNKLAARQREYKLSALEQSNSATEEVLAEMESLRQGMSKLMAKNESLEGTIDYLSCARKKVLAEMETLRQGMSKLMRELSTLKQSNSATEEVLAEMEALRQGMSTLMMELSTLKQSNSATEVVLAEMETLRQGMSKLMTELSTLKQSNSATEEVLAEMKALRQGMSKLMSKNEGLEGTIDYLSCARKTQEDRITQLEQELHEVTKSNKLAAREIEDKCMNMFTTVETFKLSTSKHRKELSELWQERLSDLEQSNLRTEKLLAEIKTLEPRMSKLHAKYKGWKVEKEGLKDRLERLEQELHTVTESNERAQPAQPERNNYPQYSYRETVEVRNPQMYSFSETVEYRNPQRVQSRIQYPSAQSRIQYPSTQSQYGTVQPRLRY